MCSAKEVGGYPQASIPDFIVPASVSIIIEGAWPLLINAVAASLDGGSNSVGIFF